jgi:hypothetical protein
VFAVLYLVFATALVWGPVALLVLLGERAIVLLEGARDEVDRRQPQVTFYVLLILAAFLVLDAVGALLS